VGPGLFFFFRVLRWVRPALKIARRLSDFDRGAAQLSPRNLAHARQHSAVLSSALPPAKTARRHRSSVLRSLRESLGLSRTIFG